MATKGGIGANYREEYRVFKEIETDPKCNLVLRNSEKVNKAMAVRYNEHIRASNLPECDKRDLLI